MEFVARNTRYNVGDFDVSLLYIWQRLFLRRVIVYLVTTISLAVISVITVRDFRRVISAITWWLFAYRYIDNHDARLSARYIAYGDADFGVLHMRFRTGAFYGALFAL